MRIIYLKFDESKMFGKASIVNSIKSQIEVSLQNIFEKYKTDNTNKNLQMVWLTLFKFYITIYWLMLIFTLAEQYLYIVL